MNINMPYSLLFKHYIVSQIEHNIVSYFLPWTLHFLSLFLKRVFTWSTKWTETSTKSLSPIFLVIQPSPWDCLLCGFDWKKLVFTMLWKILCPCLLFWLMRLLMNQWYVSHVLPTTITHPKFQCHLLKQMIFHFSPNEQPLFAKWYSTFRQMNNNTWLCLCKKLNQMSDHFSPELFFIWWVLLTWFWEGLLKSNLPSIGNMCGSESLFRKEKTLTELYFLESLLVLGLELLGSQNYVMCMCYVFMFKVVGEY